jgi:hypothetical protein
LIPTEASPIQGKLIEPLLTSHTEKWLSLSQPKFTQGLLTNSTTISPSAVLPIVPMTIQDRKHDETNFPPSLYDKDGQQVDRRSANTWSSTIEEVTTVELMEVQAINAIAPFILCSKLKPLLTKSKHVKKIFNF